MTVQERLYLTADRKTAVREGDKRAAFLLAGKGQEIPKVIAKQYGIDEDGKLKEKRGRKPADKMMDKPQDKAADLSILPAEED